MCIKIWRFYEAPEKYRKLSTNGGDEDWIAFVPFEMAEEDLVESFFGRPNFGGQVRNPFGVSDIDKHCIPDEHAYVFIGCHA
jgi:hypothetical protein